MSLKIIVKTRRDIQSDCELWLPFRAKLVSGDYELTTGCDENENDESVVLENRNEELLDEPISLKYVEIVFISNILK